MLSGDHNTSEGTVLHLEDDTVYGADADVLSRRGEQGEVTRYCADDALIVRQQGKTVR